jgi:hypothetical protein
MYISAEVDDDEVFGDMLEYIFTKLPSESKVIIARELLENLDWNVLRDHVQLTMRYNGDKKFISLLEEIIKKEPNSLLKKQMEETLSEIKKKKTTP